MTFDGFVQNASKLLLDVLRAGLSWVTQRLVKICGPHKLELRKYSNVFRCKSHLFFSCFHFLHLLVILERSLCTSGASLLCLCARCGCWFLASLAHRIFDSQATNCSVGDNSQCHSVADWASSDNSFCNSMTPDLKNLATSSQTHSNTICAWYWVS